MSKPTAHADPNSPLGQIQRGRGAGYLGILEMPSVAARDCLEDCIRHDPRLESQLDDQAASYALIGLRAEGRTRVGGGAQ